MYYADLARGKGFDTPEVIQQFLYLPSFETFLTVHVKPNLSPFLSVSSIK